MDCSELLNALLNALGERAVQVDRVLRCVRSLLEFLVAPGHNTPNNCSVVNYSILFNILSKPEMKKKLRDLPPVLSEVIEGMGTCLHDTHSAPEIAEAFGSTPKQLLEHLNSVNWKTR